MYLAKRFIDEDFLLESTLAQDLYHHVARKLPIIDFHNHLNPTFLAKDKVFGNITELWISPDQYKHRAMRICGIPEELITGSASDEEKFFSWAEVLPKTVGNPLHHWSAMELKAVFDLDILLSPATAQEVWDHCNRQLMDPAFTHNAILRQWNVEALITSDDLLDDVALHQQAPVDLGVAPSLRADTVVNVGLDTWDDWKDELSRLTDVEIDSLEAYKTAVLQRMDTYDATSCQLADHGLDAGFRFIPTETDDASRYFQKVLRGESLVGEELVRLRSHLLEFMGQQYGDRNWGMQLHIGAQRATSTRLRLRVGAAGGYAGIGSSCDIASLATFLDRLETRRLPKTILYTLNPADYPAFASLTGSFSEDHVQGKIQLGPSWWYNDHLPGIEQHYQVLSNYGLISTFIGMTTDSRSILSFSRHDYFRRVLCNCIGRDVQRGVIPEDQEILSHLVTGICYENIKRWLK